MALPIKTNRSNSGKISERQRLLKMWESLEKDRSSFFSHWQDLNDFVLPRRLRYLQTDVNKGTKRNDKIFNNTASLCARILGAGKMACETSPAREWYNYVPPVEAKDDTDAQDWLADTKIVVSLTFAKSNLYNCLHTMWHQQGTFATCAMYVEEDDEDDARGYIFPLGQYVLAASAKGRIDTILRKFSMTVDQIVREFGYEAASQGVQLKYDNGQLYDWVEVMHTIEPNVGRQVGKIDNHNMPFISRWLEVAGLEAEEKFLRVSGYEEFPVVVARWDVVGEDVYGTDCPAMLALGDIKGLQKMEKRGLEASDKLTGPPMKAPVSAKTLRLSALPNDATYVDETAQGTKFEPIYQLDVGILPAVDGRCARNERRIVEAFYVNLFQMMLRDESVQPRTATDVIKRDDERMLQLGPVVQRDEDDVLDPLHNRIVHILARRGKLRPAPESLRGGRVKVEYVSVMAQAQKLLGTASLERAMSFAGSLSAVKKEVLDIPNVDKIMRKHFDDLGIPPNLMNSEEAVAQTRAQRAQQEQQKAVMEQTLAGVQGAKVASETDMGGDTALTRLLGTVGGAGWPAGA